MDRPKKNLVALSGGVDSAVAAALLKAEGHTVSAAYMKNWINEENVFGNCPWQQDIEDASAVADHLGIPFQVINFMQDYRERVVHYLVKGYESGQTPNPDVMCNREMKFGVMLDWALDHGFDGVATGHYCRKDVSGPEPALLEGVDPNKDQSYFLAMITPTQLEHAWFPIGHLLKPEVRALASELGLPNATKKDSQGICFIGEVRINDFLEKFIPDKPGPILHADGRELGTHRGLHRYTLGQRRGIGIPSNSNFNHYVVLAKDVARNALIVGFDSPDTDGLYHQSARLHNLSWMTRCPPEGQDVPLLAKVRYRDPSVPCFFSSAEGDSALLRFQFPQRALAPGQICALYDGQRLLGGGVFGQCQGCTD
ncbi:MAG: tRNA 2-thiouridine(34) synthase MnmA [Verrucomicrobia bacterium]|nr:tRNA 2-thiouridine(34) synthase MnmA [Verrucomicrobiota bacterium]